MNNQKQTYSWTIVVIALIVFWPVGLFLLIGKLSNDRSASFGGGSGLVKFVGIILLIIAVSGLTTFTSGDSSVMTGGIIMAIVFALPGIWLLKKSKVIKNDGYKNKAYINYIVNNQVHDVAELARRMNVSQDVVIRDVNGMISKGMLGRARLNLNNGRIEFPRPKPSTTHRDAYNRPSTPHRDERQTRQRPVEDEYKPFQPKTIRCSACSANNFVETLPAQCDYCGTSLHETK
ncbi:hypothetical protein KQ51_00755 [Candidatus Izimaplasma bacterium HR1]|jgi:flagellar biogenesis protein FliO|uniref:hypothetical protein n=1 Tax=Candidatus Izimoplasma sp. HR1 TaxID=1541959 RepID=UPI0004F80D26|nr:hypothetical protein KQ51_00755 [Candidatus Izimaplasma bacterium HR1]